MEPLRLSIPLSLRRPRERNPAVNDKPWYQQFFGEDYLRTYLPALPDEKTEAQVDGIVSCLGLQPPARVLDLCCGHGRHAVRFAERGYEVAGQDLSELFLARARDDAERRGVTVQWVHGDMREIPFEGELDAVINMFTAFGYLEDEEEDLKVLRQVAKALKPGGRLLLETMHRDNLLRRFLPYSVTRHADGLVVTDEREIDVLTSRINVVSTFFEPDGRRYERRHSLRLYTLRELVRMLSAAGLEFERACGGLDGSPVTLESQRLVVISRRPTGSGGG